MSSKGFKVSVEALEMEPKDVTELLQSHDKTLMNEEFLPMDEQRKWIVEITKDLECYINVVVKAAAGFERTDLNFENSSTVGKCYQTASHTTEKLLVKRRIN